MNKNILNFDGVNYEILHKKTPLQVFMAGYDRRANTMRRIKAYYIYIVQNNGAKFFFYELKDKYLTKPVLFEGSFPK